jgi:hypothetical protein
MVLIDEEKNTCRKWSFNMYFFINTTKFKKQSNKISLRSKNANRKNTVQFLHLTIFTGPLGRIQDHVDGLGQPYSLCERSGRSKEFWTDLQPVVNPEDNTVLFGTALLHCKPVRIIVFELFNGTVPLKWDMYRKHDYLLAVSLPKKAITVWITQTWK